METSTTEALICLDSLEEHFKEDENKVLHAFCQCQAEETVIFSHCGIKKHVSYKEIQSDAPPPEKRCLVCIDLLRKKVPCSLITHVFNS